MAEIFKGSHCPASLPISAEIDARLVAHHQRYDAIDLAAVGIAPMIFPPRCLLREADQIRAGNVVVVSDLAAPQPREETFGGIRVDVVLAAEAVCLLMVDPV